MTALETDRRSFLRAICENPADDVVRLVYADWLEENGERSLHAEMIRLQIGGRVPSNRPGRWVKAAIGESGGSLLEWTNGFGKQDRSITAYATREGVVAYSAFTAGSDERNAQRRRILITRGFVSRVSLSCKVFMQHAGALFAEHPITEVRLTDRTARHGLPFPPLHFGWQILQVIQPATANYMIPTEIFSRMVETGGLSNWRHYVGVDAANTSLSAACVSYGRSLAGLPALSSPHGIA